MKLNILCLYPNMLDLYGDNNNIDILRYRAKKRNIEFDIDSYTIEDEVPNFSSYDLVFLSSSGDEEQKIIIKDLIRHKKEIKSSIKDGTFYLLISDGFHIFGKYFVDYLGNKVNGLNIFDYYTEDGTKCIGDIILESNLKKENIKLLGFENHSSQTYNVKTTLGKVLYGNGNSYKDKEEGFMQKNVIGTNMHGPFLSKNPELTDYILNYCLERKYKKQIKLEKIDDEFENIAKKEMLDKLLGNI